MSLFNRSGVTHPSCPLDALCGPLFQLTSSPLLTLPHRGDAAGQTPCCAMTVHDGPRLFRGWLSQNPELGARRVTRYVCYSYLRGSTEELSRLAAELEVVRSGPKMPPTTPMAATFALFSWVLQRPLHPCRESIRVEVDTPLLDAFDTPWPIWLITGCPGPVPDQPGCVATRPLLPRPPLWTSPHS